MPYLWLEEQPRNSNILDSYGFDRAFANPKNVLNGWLDRENLPTNCVSLLRTQTGATTKIYVNTDIHEEDVYTCPVDTFAYPTNKGNVILGNAYNESPLFDGGEWLHLYSTTRTVGEGMLSVYWKCWAYISKLLACPSNFEAGQFAKCSLTFQIRHNGCIMAQSGEYYGSWCNPHLQTSFPVAAGTSLVSVYFRAPRRGLLEHFMVETVVSSYIGGGQLNLVNRTR